MTVVRVLFDGVGGMSRIIAGSHGLGMLRMRKVPVGMHGMCVRRFMLMVHHLRRVMRTGDI